MDVVITANLFLHVGDDCIWILIYLNYYIVLFPSGDCWLSLNESYNLISHVGYGVLIVCIVSEWCALIWRIFPALGSRLKGSIWEWILLPGMSLCVALVYLEIQFLNLCYMVFGLYYKWGWVACWILWELPFRN